MTDLSKIHRVILCDGYGRTFETINPTEIRTMEDLGTLFIYHDGDTQHSLKGEP